MLPRTTPSEISERRPSEAVHTINAVRDPTANAYLGVPRGRRKLLPTSTFLVSTIFPSASGRASANIGTVRFCFDIRFGFELERPAR